MHNPKCAAMHLDAWCIKSDWLQNMVSAIKSGVVLADSSFLERSMSGNGYAVRNGVAIVPLMGPLMKGWSKFGGTSSIWARNAIRNANRDESVRGIMLHIDSPGGTVSGTAELADEIKVSSKPIHAYIEDLGASAAYWAASQAAHVSMNRAGMAGSIGVYVALEDTSGMADAQGVKVHVLSTGPIKGAGQPGTKITDEQLAAYQDIVNSHFALFESAVRSGRRMLRSQFEAVSDGRVFDAQAAKSLNLIDTVESFDSALIRLKKAK